MRRKTKTTKPPAEKVVQDIRRRTRKHRSAEEKIRIVLDGLREEPPLQLVQGVIGGRRATTVGRHGEAGPAPQVKELRAEASALKEAVADLTLENRLLKKACSGMGEAPHEIPRLGKAGDHPPGRRLALAGEAHAGEARRPAQHLPPLVRQLAGLRRSRAQGPSTTSRPGLESDPGRGALGGRGPSAGRDEGVAPGAGSALHRREKALRVRGFRLPHPQGPGPDRQPSPRGGQGRRRVP